MTTWIPIETGRGLRAACALASLAGFAGACTDTTAGRDDTGNPTTSASASDGNSDGNDDSTTTEDPSITIDPTNLDGSDGLTCGESMFVLEALPPNVVLVLDRSGSMTDNSWDADSDPGTPDITRWNSLYNVAESVVGDFDAQINFGAQFFPSSAAFSQLGQGACLTNATPEVEVAPGNGANVLAALPAADVLDLAGATPAAAGITSARSHLLTLDDTVARFMILVTDGAANCGADADMSMCPGVGCGLMEEYDDNLPLVVGAAFNDDGIATYVVGIDILDELVGVGDDGQPEANTFARLNDVAVAGGRPNEGGEKFFNALNEIELQAALEEIAGQVFSCTVALDPIPEHPEFVEVEIGDEEIPRVRDCTTEDGWVFTNPEGPYDSLQLCGTACTTLGEAGMLDAIYGCPPQG